MSELTIPNSQHDQVRRLVRLSDELAAGLAEADRWHHEQLVLVREQAARVHADLAAQAESTQQTLSQQMTTQLEAARLRFETQLEQLEEVRGLRSDEVARQRAKTIAEAEDDCEQSELRLKDHLRADLEQLKRKHEQLVRRAREAGEAWGQVRADVVSHLQQRGVMLPAGSSPEVDPEPNVGSSTWLRRFEAQIEQIVATLQANRGSRIHRYLQEGWSVLVFLLLVGVSIFPWRIVVGNRPVTLTVAVLVSSLTLAAALHQILHRIAAQRLRVIAPQLAGELQQTKRAIGEGQRASKRETQAGQEELKRETTRQKRAARAARDAALEGAESRYRQQSQELEQGFQQQLAAFQHAWDQEADGVRGKYRPLLAERKVYFETQQTCAQQEAEERIRRVESEYDEARETLRDRWRNALQAFEQFVGEIRSACPTAVEELTSAEIDRWQPATAPPQAVPIGHYDFQLPPHAGALAQMGTPVALPALLTFPEQGSLLLETEGVGREQAVEVLRSAALRLLAAFPPGKLRLTIFDPIGLGQNFSAFMHLADFDERLVGNRIWTEAPHLNQRLCDLTEHMENVIQKYLRNEYRSIQEYNEQAGEVAEPFRVLIVANYPTQFTDEATRRLISIAQSGPRCGIYTLMSVDRLAKQVSPAILSDLEANAQVFRWTGERFQNTRPPLADMPLSLDPPPPGPQLTQLVKAVGRHAQDTRRVQVPFSYVTPDEEAIWQSDCAEELVVPLGRTGATQRLALRLGQGTSQHALVSGKTGSGKSTLMHALITNAALHYSPDQLQFYLIDFKKGVEFKAYADLELPHARVIAIESEREFGLSVLQQLDHELRQRGDLFRAAGVQNLAAYRQREPGRALPRLLLIVDEFQEFFVNDDRIAHEAALLLDRLVRQGRAFGMHVVLGSQTLAGAYSLARSTLGQMAVRIALECSAADAHLILSEDNTAARLLGRPGEAIYNDANGRVEGNHPFQVVWLADEQRNASLTRVHLKAKEVGYRGETPIVFEGHAAADLRGNAQLQRWLTDGRSAGDRRSPTAWLGSAIAIKEPTCAVFRRQAGSNLLLVGQSRELGAGVLSSSIVSLVAGAQISDSDHERRMPQFLVLEGGRLENAESDFADRLRPHLPDPNRLRVGGPSQMRATLTQASEWLEERLADPERLHEPVYLVIFDLVQFRDLQTADDFGLGSFGKDAGPEPPGQLARLLREGPAVDIHTLLWADCYHTLSRWLERQTLRDFGQRILFQMSAVDSSHLMDSASASHLGAYRAILYDHDRGLAEKFRPYGVPDADWLQWFHERLELAAGATPDLPAQPVNPPNSGVDR